MRQRQILAAFCLIVFVAFAGSTANTLLNPNFTTDIANWNSGGLWAIAHTSAEGAGALQVTATSAGGSTGALAAWQCTNAAAASVYDYGGMFKIEPTSTQTGGARLRVTWFTGPGCTGVLETTLFHVDATSVAGWQSLAVENLTAPAGTTSVMIELIQSIDDTGNFIAYWDDIYFGTDPTPVQIQSFSVE